jgi:hypothetical protein
VSPEFEDYNRPGYVIAMTYTYTIELPPRRRALLATDGAAATAVAANSEGPARRRHRHRRALSEDPSETAPTTRTSRRRHGRDAEAAAAAAAAATTTARSSIKSVRARNIDATIEYESAYQLIVTPVGAKLYNEENPVGSDFFGELTQNLDVYTVCTIIVFFKPVIQYI